MIEETIQRLIRDATEPLEAQIKDLRAEVAALRARLDGEPAPSPSSPTVQSALETAEPSSEPAPPTPADVPAERTDFMRFIQRGLEQEEREYAKEPEPTKPEKKGWNPFKR
jgi:hypothetical protein